MNLYWMTVLSDRQPNSVWDALWSHTLDSKLDNLLSTTKELSSNWIPPKIKYQKRLAQPDIYSLQLGFAVNENAKNVLSHAVGDLVEFLPLVAKSGINLYAIHCLRWLEPSPESVYETCDIGGNMFNITYLDVIPPKRKKIPMLFQITQPLGSAARSIDVAYSRVFVTSEFVELVDEHSLKGVHFIKIN